MSNEIILDARGLLCPMPLLKAKLALNGLKTGQKLKVLATDQGSKRDIPAFIELSPHRLLVQSEENGDHIFLIEKQ